MNIYAVILAGGSSSRFGGKIPKQFIEVNGRWILEYSLDVFCGHGKVGGVVVVAHSDYVDMVRDRLGNKVYDVVEGGINRMQSAFNAIKSLDGIADVVLIHDGARPFVSKDIIDRCIEALDSYKAVVPVVGAVDTIGIVSNNKLIDIPPRNTMVHIQTPQGFYFEIIKRAYNIAIRDNIIPTDDSSLIIRYNLADVYTVEGDKQNIKITYRWDIEMFDKLNIK